MIKAAIAIEAWKRQIFERHLRADAFEYEVFPGITEDTLTISVTTPSATRLEPTVRRANAAAAKLRN